MWKYNATAKRHSAQHLFIPSHKSIILLGINAIYSQFWIRTSITNIFRPWNCKKCGWLSLFLNVISVLIDYRIEKKKKVNTVFIVKDFSIQYSIQQLSIWNYQGCEFKLSSGQFTLFIVIYKINTWCILNLQLLVRFLQIPIDLQSNLAAKTILFHFGGERKFSIEFLSSPM